MSKSSCTPVPNAEISACTSVFWRILSIRAFSTFRILPRIGRIAWYFGLRPDFAEPPAESPSTMKISHFVGSFDWQSLSLPGSDARLQQALAAGEVARLTGRDPGRGAPGSPCG